MKLVSLSLAYMSGSEAFRSLFSLSVSSHVFNSVRYLSVSETVIDSAASTLDLLSKLLKVRLFGFLGGSLTHSKEDCEVVCISLLSRWPEEFALEERSGFGVGVGVVLFTL
ncbi:hypothetical protein WICPIJ_005384 [Wickerhamomyces pijperi]|uniref:Uncharacterized protein n=1 Tax=Wickerhamomyces pijperi TaxID=599730 RepID=A0A9P8Q6C0_WICPI|nr:hypothetical protein WICPIJ_005384 [Wickerhamomyces pijperi]